EQEEEDKEDNEDTPQRQRLPKRNLSGSANKQQPDAKRVCSVARSPSPAVSVHSSLAIPTPKSSSARPSRNVSFAGTTIDHDDDDDDDDDAGDEASSSPFPGEEREQDGDGDDEETPRKPRAVSASAVPPCSSARAQRTLPLSPVKDRARRPTG